MLNPVSDNAEITVPQDEVPEMVSIREAARRTGLSYDFLRKSCLAGRIVHIRIGTGKFLINYRWLVSWMESSRGV